jgi:hypothetical protein
MHNPISKTTNICTREGSIWLAYFFDENNCLNNSQLGWDNSWSTTDEVMFFSSRAL